MKVVWGCLKFCVYVLLFVNTQKNVEDYYWPINVHIGKVCADYVEYNEYNDYADYDEYDVIHLLWYSSL